MEKTISKSPGVGNNQEQVLARKVYKKPSLTVYGDIAELTQAGGSKVSDGILATGKTAPVRKTPTPLH